MRATAAQPPDLLWLVERAAHPLSPRATAIKAVDTSGRIRGMVAFDDWWPNSCHVHMAVETPIAWRALIPACAIYPFEQLGLGVLIACVLSTNARSLRMTLALGFRETHRVRDGYAPGVDLVFHEIRREDVEAKGWLLPSQGKAA